ncbi:hypothetical protein [Granulicella paludicola]|jgi:hypothetical protein|uniref:hypothetical protein n=1 Tax=Granulicella paludicola TaxID=474951 RepID=UPI0021E09932|nr:hypothetical protein [Granulicella paludicola]
MALTCGLLFAEPSEAPVVESTSAQELVRGAVFSELRANNTDKSNWRYRDQSNSPSKAETFDAIETPQGELRRLIAINSHELTPAEDRKEKERIREYVDSPDEQAKAQRDGQHDDAQAERFLKMLPDAFTWSVATQTPEETTLRYEPNPAFKPPTMESRVLAAMEGEMVIARDGDRIKSLRGKLSHEVKIGYGLLGRLDQGGTFDVERRPVAPGHWQIVENHVHIGGRALLFKNISQNADEIKTGWKPSTDKTLAEAQRSLGVQ